MDFAVSMRGHGFGEHPVALLRRDVVEIADSGSPVS